MAPANVTVVFSQAGMRDAGIATLEEQMIGGLLMTAGMNANLVGPLESMQADSTDCLCLSGFRGSLVVLSWLETEQVQEHWRRLGLPGVVSPFGAGATMAGQVIYHMPLSTDRDAGSVIADLLQVQQDRAVKTVGINLPGASGESAVVKSAVVKSVVVPPVKPSSAGRVSPASVPSGQRSSAVPAADGVARGAAGSRDSGPGDSGQLASEDDEFPELEKLVDDLDAMDW